MAVSCRITVEQPLACFWIGRELWRWMTFEAFWGILSRSWQTGSQKSNCSSKTSCAWYEKFYWSKHCRVCQVTLAYCKERVISRGGGFPPCCGRWTPMLITYLTHRGVRNTTCFLLSFLLFATTEGKLRKWWAEWSCPPSPPPVYFDTSHPVLLHIY